MQRDSEGPDRKRYQDNSAFQKVETVTLDLDRECHVYDLLAASTSVSGQKLRGHQTRPLRADHLDAVR